MGPASLPTPLSPACGPFRRGVLDAWRMTAGRLRLARPALAPVPDVPVAGSDREDLSLAIRQPATGSVSPATSSGSASAKASALPSVAGHRVVRPFASGDARWDALSFVGIALAGASLCPTGFALCFTFASSASVELLGSGSAGDPSLRCLPLSAFDVWRMPLGAESGKQAAWHLSTFGGMASGQRWISQQLVANRATSCDWLSGDGRAGPASAAAGR